MTFSDTISSFLRVFTWAPSGATADCSENHPKVVQFPLKLEAHLEKQRWPLCVLWSVCGIYIKMVPAVTAGTTAKHTRTHCTAPCMPR